MVLLVLFVVFVLCGVLYFVVGIKVGCIVDEVMGVWFKGVVFGWGVVVLFVVFGGVFGVGLVLVLGGFFSVFS